SIVVGDDQEKLIVVRASREPTGSAVRLRAGPLRDSDQGSDVSQSSLRLAAIAVVLLAPAALTAAAAEPRCVAETCTTACHNRVRELRIIRNTVSPSGHYGVAWEVPDDGSAEEWEQNGKKDGSKLAGAYDGSREGGHRVRNFLLRLPDGKPIR